MIKKLRIVQYINGAVAQFETRSEDEQFMDKKVKHYVYQDGETRGFWHERRYLISSNIEPIHDHNLDISDRVFWGKVRLLKYRDCCFPETWDAIATSIKNIKKIKFRQP